MLSFGFWLDWHYFAFSCTSHPSLVIHLRPPPGPCIPKNCILYIAEKGGTVDPPFSEHPWDQVVLFAQLGSVRSLGLSLGKCWQTIVNLKCEVILKSHVQMFKTYRTISNNAKMAWDYGRDPVCYGTCQNMNGTQFSGLRSSALWEAQC